MMERSGGENFVGCACDHKFVKHTATMLASLDVNGDVPDATVIVVAFELDQDDREMIRAGAGRLGGRLRFVDVVPEDFSALAHHKFRETYPLPVLGRFTYREPY